MIRVTVELDSAITGETTVIGKATIYNDGTGTKQKGNYKAVLIAPTEKAEMTEVKDFPRLERDAWDLLYVILHRLRGPKK